MATFSKADLETLSHDGFTNNGQQYFYVAAVTSPSLLAKLKSNENGMPGRLHQIQFLVLQTRFYIFSKMPITLCFTNILFQFEN